MAVTVKQSLVCSYVLLPLLVLVLVLAKTGQGQGFARTSGTRFVTEGNRSLYLNGFNAYWLMQLGSNPSEKAKVTNALQQASGYGMNIARTWAFSDGGSNPLQISPGSYDENMFKGLDFVISEAKKYGVYLILSLVNNFKDYGGRQQYVQWGKEHGQNLSSDDDFFTNIVVKGYYKNHIKAVLTRVNSITGVAYKDDPTVFAWELMNEPRCQSDLSGKAIQDWAGEMAVYVKSIDTNHLLEIGLEGFYGESKPERKVFNPGNYEVGTDFVSNNQIPEVDFATIHVYPDQWSPGSTEEEQVEFVDRWVEAHIQDSNSVLGKPILVGEFGKTSRSPGYNVSQRDSYFGRLYDAIYNSASAGGPCGGGLFWQLMAQGMDNYKDGYEVILEQSPTTADVIDQQSRKLSTIS